MRTGYSSRATVAATTDSHCSLELSYCCNIAEELAAVSLNTDSDSPSLELARSVVVVVVAVAIT